MSVYFNCTNNNTKIIGCLTDNNRIIWYNNNNPYSKTYEWEKYISFKSMVESATYDAENGFLQKCILEIKQGFRENGCRLVGYNLEGEL